MVEGNNWLSYRAAVAGEFVCLQSTSVRIKQRSYRRNVKCVKNSFQINDRRNLELLKNSKSKLNESAVKRNAL